MDLWISAAGALRGLLRGWGANHGSEAKRAREALIDEIKSLDAQAACRPFLEAEWANRYALENQVLSILREEEEYWCCGRGGVKLVTKGDANTGYFHAYANRRKRKCTILRLQADQGVLVSQADISAHIYEFFHNLLGTAEEKHLRLRADFWGDEARVSQAENDLLDLSFSTEEIDMVAGSMKIDTTPGPVGWPVAFFRCFFPALKALFHDIINGFALGTVDISNDPQV
ncbi:uncharacterized protein [Aegilops tauschii subsp. strangulata]|uniref:uncharacterized protein n=1 Tax=Aegilops tauschii subsp. strangulata TaxID=200361 RepID=UPI001ABD071E|nr:uncharacterized protein LOC120964861 [Aegilops tauschii subsp. strangulata]